jgi:hypothetical protein
MCITQHDPENPLSEYVLAHDAVERAGTRVDPKRESAGGGALLVSRSKVKVRAKGDPGGMRLMAQTDVAKKGSHGLLSS